jgi:hypothetical protein
MGEEEEDEPLDVVQPHTVVDPGTVVVKSRDALVANWAWFRVWRSSVKGLEIGIFVIYRGPMYGWKAYSKVEKSLQCLDLAGRDNMHVEHSLSEYMTLSIGYLSSSDDMLSSLITPASAIQVQGLGLRVEGPEDLGFRIEGLVLQILGWGLRVPRIRIEIEGEALKPCSKKIPKRSYNVLTVTT